VLYQQLAVRHKDLTYDARKRIHETKKNRVAVALSNAIKNATATRFFNNAPWVLLECRRDAAFHKAAISVILSINSKNQIPAIGDDPFIQSTLP
jgi:hypothetical protein